MKYINIDYSDELHTYLFWTKHLSFILILFEYLRDPITIKHIHKHISFVPYLNLLVFELKTF